MDKLLHVKLEGEIAELLVKVNPTYQQLMTKEHGQPIIYAELNKALWHSASCSIVLADLSKFLIEEHGFTVNPYDWCIVNC